MSSCKLVTYGITYCLLVSITGSPSSSCLFTFLCYHAGISCISWWTASLFYNRVFSPKMPRVSPSQKAVFITGCDSGFGLQTAIDLSRRGYHVFAGVLSEESPGAMKLKELSKSGGHRSLTIHRCDVTDASSLLSCLHEVESFLERNDYFLHAVVNNAGINLPNLFEFHKPSSVVDYEAMMNVNLLGIVRVSRLFLPLLRRTTGGRIVNMGSQAGRTVAYGNSSYCVSKAAVIKLTECLNTEVTQFGIKCISVEPFFFKTQVPNLPRLTKHMEDSWKDSFSEVKSAYAAGSSDPEKQRKKLTEMIDSFTFFSTNEQFTNPNIGESVEMIVDAVTSVDPEFVYSRVPFLPKVYLWLVSILPYDIQFFLNQQQGSLNRFVLKTFSEKGKNSSKLSENVSND